MQHTLSFSLRSAVRWSGAYAWVQPQTAALSTKVCRRFNSALSSQWNLPSESERCTGLDVWLIILLNCNMIFRYTYGRNPLFRIITAFLQHSTLCLHTCKTHPSERRSGWLPGNRKQLNRRRLIWRSQTHRPPATNSWTTFFHLSAFYPIAVLHT